MCVHVGPSCGVAAAVALEAWATERGGFVFLRLRSRVEFSLERVRAAGTGETGSTPARHNKRETKNIGHGAVADFD